MSAKKPIRTPSDSLPLMEVRGSSGEFLEELSKEANSLLSTHSYLKALEIAVGRRIRELGGLSTESSLVFEIRIQPEKVWRKVCFSFVFKLTVIPGTYASGDGGVG